VYIVFQILVKKLSKTVEQMYWTRIFM